MSEWERESKGERKSLFKSPLLVVRHRRCTRCDSRVAALNDCVVAELSAVQSQSAMGGLEWHNIITAQDGGIIITSYRTSDAGIGALSLFFIESKCENEWKATKRKKRKKGRRIEMVKIVWEKFIFKCRSLQQNFDWKFSNIHSREGFYLVRFSPHDDLWRERDDAVKCLYFSAKLISSRGLLSDDESPKLGRDDVSQLIVSVSPASASAGVGIQSEGLARRRKNNQFWPAWWEDDTIAISKLLSRSTKHNKHEMWICTTSRRTN